MSFTFLCRVWGQHLAIALGAFADGIIFVMLVDTMIPDTFDKRHI